jgi:Xaa-Pro aminopeptidase
MPGLVDRARAARLMAEARCDALLIAAPETFRWATGAEPGVAQAWRRLGPAIAVLPADPALPVAAVMPDLFAPGGEAAGVSPLARVPIWVESADAHAHLDAPDAAALIARAHAGRPAGFARPSTFDRGTALAALAGLLRGMGLAGARLGSEDVAIPASDHGALAAALPEARLHDASRLIERLRAVKTPGEIVRLREAARLTESALAALLPTIRAGETRAALAARFRSLIPAPAACWEYIGFGPDPWATRDPLQPGDVVKIDVGAVVGGYTADLARSAVLGAPDPRAEAVQAAMVAAFEAGRPLFRPAARLADIHAACLAAARAHLPSYARGHFGHGLGATIFSEEWPYTAADSDAVLEPGMVMAFEAPFYVSGLGGFIAEDMLLITEDGAETLAGGTLPRGLIRL